MCDSTLDLSEYDKEILFSAESALADPAAKSCSILDLLNEFNKKPRLTCVEPQDSVHSPIKSPVMGHRIVKATRVKHQKSGSVVQETISTVNLPFQRNLLSVLKPSSPKKIARVSTKATEELAINPEILKPATKELLQTEGNDPIEPRRSTKTTLSLKEPLPNYLDLSILNRRQIKSLSIPVNVTDDPKRINLPTLCSQETVGEPTTKASTLHSPKPSLGSSLHFLQMNKDVHKEKISSPCSLQTSTLSTMESIGKRRVFFFAKPIEINSSISNCFNPSGKNIEQRRHTEILDTKTSIESPTFPASVVDSPLFQKAKSFHKKNDSRPGRKVILKPRKDFSTDTTQKEPLETENDF